MALPVQVIRLTVIGAVVASVVAFKVIAGNNVEKRLDKIVQESQGAFSYENASVDLLGLDVHIDGVRIHDGGRDVNIDEIIIHSYDEKSEVPQFMDVEVNGIELDMQAINNDPALGKVVKGLGYEKLEANMAMDYKVDSKKKLFNLKEFSFAIKDAGELELSAEIYGVSSLQEFGNYFMRPQMLKLGDISVSYEDDSLVERIIKMNAQEAGMDVSSYKEKLLTGIEREIEKAKAKNEDEKVDILEEIYDFLDNPKEFEVSIEPKEPVSFAKLSRLSNDEIKELLHIEITAN
jgi:hypothetical protein